MGGAGWRDGAVPGTLSREVRTGAVSGTDPGQVGVSLWGWSHTLSLSRIRVQVLHFVHPESFCPPWRFPAGMWQLREQN